MPVCCHLSVYWCYVCVYVCVLSLCVPIYHRRLKLKTDGGYARVHELGSIDLFVVTSLKMNQLSPNLVTIGSFSKKLQQKD